MAHRTHLVVEVRALDEALALQAGRQRLRPPVGLHRRADRRARAHAACRYQGVTSKPTEPSLEGTGRAHSLVTHAATPPRLRAAERVVVTRAASSFLSH